MARLYGFKIIQLILSGLFLFSAITKLLSLESFELFIYNLLNISYDTATIIARVVIGLELILSVLFLYKQYYKPSTILSFITTLGFSIFLFSHLDVKNCYCFGPNFPFTAKESLIKNGLTIIVILVHYLIAKKQILFTNKIPNLFMCILSFMLFAIPFAVYPPNCFIRIFNKSQSLQSTKINDAKHINAIKTALAFYKIPLNKKMIIPIISSQCKYCKNAINMLTEFDNKHHFNTITNLLIIGDSLETKKFISLTSKDRFAYNSLFVDHFMAISNGVIPKFLFQKNNQYYLTNTQGLNDASFEEFLKD